MESRQRLKQRRREIKCDRINARGVRDFAPACGDFYVFSFAETLDSRVFKLEARIIIG